MFGQPQRPVTLPAGTVLRNNWLSTSSLLCPSCAYGPSLPMAPGIHQCSGTPGCCRLEVQLSSVSQTVDILTPTVKQSQ